MTIHIGDAGTGLSKCGIKPDKYVWTPEKATCKKCLAAYQKKIKKRPRSNLN